MLWFCRSDLLGTELLYRTSLRTSLYFIIIGTAGSLRGFFIRRQLVVLQVGNGFTFAVVCSVTEKVYEILLHLAERLGEGDGLLLEDQISRLRRGGQAVPPVRVVGLLCRLGVFVSGIPSDQFFQRKVQGVGEILRPGYGYTSLSGFYAADGCFIRIAELPGKLRLG